MGFSVLGFSVPVFVLGYLLIYIFAIRLGLFPVQGYAPLADGFWPFIHRLILPSLTLSVIFIALIARITRASVMEALQEDYIRTARAKGQTEKRILLFHALKNAAVPIVTAIGFGLGLLIGGVVVTRKRLQHPRPRPIDGGRRARARLPDHPGRHSGLLLRLCDRQSPDRHRLYDRRSEDSLLSGVADPSETSRTSSKSGSPFKTGSKSGRPSIVQRLGSNSGVRVGGIVLLPPVSPRPCRPVSKQRRSHDHRSDPAQPAAARIQCHHRRRRRRARGHPLDGHGQPWTRPSIAACSMALACR